MEVNPLVKSLSDYFEGTAVKYLTAVDADSSRSNQHEIGGLIKARFDRYIGKPQGGEKAYFSCQMIFISDDADLVTQGDATVTWYDTRWDDPERSPEYRMYYEGNKVTDCLQEGDLMVVAKRSDGTLLMMFAPSGSTAEQQIKVLFGVAPKADGFSVASIPERELVLSVRMMLEELGLELEFSGERDEHWEELLLGKFGLKFPETSVFSSFARETIEGVSSVDDPDQALVCWMEHEERLFRILERCIIRERLKIGFEDDVDSFISFSLSVQNRRKSRVGFALEHHLNQIFIDNELCYEQGKGKRLYTENKQKPDFIFPSFAKYHESSFSVGNLRMLGAKTTCKERWRQVLAEADRILPKHLLTLQPGISADQIDEMKSKELRLVVPIPVQSNYAKTQQGWLVSLKDFISEVKSLEGQS